MDAFNLDDILLDSIPGLANILSDTADAVPTAQGRFVTPPRAVRTERAVYLEQKAHFCSKFSAIVQTHPKHVS